MRRDIMESAGAGPIVQATLGVGIVIGFAARRPGRWFGIEAARVVPRRPDDAHHLVGEADRGLVEAAALGERHWPGAQSIERLNTAMRFTLHPGAERDIADAVAFYRERAGISVHVRVLVVAHQHRRPKFGIHRR